MPAFIRKALFFVLIIFPILVEAQPAPNLKKKCFGTYAGTIPAYKYDSGSKLLDVAETDILLTINQKTVSIKIGANEQVYTYNIFFEASNYFLLNCTNPGNIVNERILVYKKGDKISRDGLYPQPTTQLLRKKKK